MPHYDEFYHPSGRITSSPRLRPHRRWHHARRALPDRYPYPYDEDHFYGADFGEYRPMGALPEGQERMGMRDFSERYGRYSGGSPYSYEYSERTVHHRPRHPGVGPFGFSRPLAEDRTHRYRRRGRWSTYR